MATKYALLPIGGAILTQGATWPELDGHAITRLYVHLVLSQVMIEGPCHVHERLLETCCGEAHQDTYTLRVLTVPSRLRHLPLAGPLGPRVHELILWPHEDNIASGPLYMLAVCVSAQHVAAVRSGALHFTGRQAWE